MLDADILPGLNHPAPGFLCINLLSKDHSSRYRVPVIHTPLEGFFTELPSGPLDLEALAALPDLPSTQQLRTLLRDGQGLGLFVSKYLHEHQADLGEEFGTQELSGSVLVYPPRQWSKAKTQWSEWFFDGADEAFRGLPYDFDDVLPFAGLNFSPDLWYLVLKGPMAGKVCRWTHDGDSQMDQPWANDIKAWGERLWAELPDVFGGIIRFWGRDSIDPLSEKADLSPEAYSADINLPVG